MSALLDLNDVNLRLWTADRCLRSPGYAWHDGSRYQFGDPAMRTSRRTPRAVHTRYWTQLNTQPLTPPLGPARHSADLAHGHLSALLQDAGQVGPWLLAVPGNMGRDALSLLLGIAPHVPIEIAGLTHRSALIAAANGITHGLHIELQLHQLLVTPLQAQSHAVEAQASLSLPGQGLLALQDRLATTLADLFVQQTRFDPLRSADAEQALYDAMGETLDALREQAETTITIGDYSARVTRDDLLGIGRALSQQLAPLLTGAGPALIEYPLSLLPGLDLDRPLQAISTSSLADYARQHAAELQQPADGLMVQRALPVTAQAAGVVDTLDTVTDSQAAIPDHGANGVNLGEAAVRPTHRLDGTHARRLGHETNLSGSATLHFDGDALTLTGRLAPDFLVNGEVASPGQVLKAGDHLTDSLGLDCRLIVVED